MPTLCEEVKKQINKGVHEALASDGNGNVFPHVCIVCDHLLKKEEDVRITSTMLKKRSSILAADGFADISNLDLIEDYCYGYLAGRMQRRQRWMDKVLLSPRANYMAGTGRGNQGTYSCCADCKQSLESGFMPVNAIANKHTYGNLPKALAALNEIEWSLITPLKGGGYSHTFVYGGGYAKKLRGVLVYQRVEEATIAQAILQLEALGLNGHVIVLFTGKMTQEQKEIAREKTEIRVDHVIAAIEWLSVNNILWKHVDLEAIRVVLSEMDPNVVDESETIDGSKDSQENNIETTHTFAAYFPDGTMKTVFGV